MTDRHREKRSRQYRYDHDRSNLRPGPEDGPRRGRFLDWQEDDTTQRPNREDGGGYEVGEPSDPGHSPYQFMEEPLREGVDHRPRPRGWGREVGPEDRDWDHDRLYYEGRHTQRSPDGALYGYGRRGWGDHRRSLYADTQNRDSNPPRDRRGWVPEGSEHPGYSVIDTSPGRPGRVGGLEEAQLGPYSGVGPRGYRRSDERILDDVADRLSRDGWVDGQALEVRVEEGEVTVEGIVDDRRTKHYVENLIASATGVLDVHNRLRLARRDHQMVAPPKGIDRDAEEVDADESDSRHTHGPMTSQATTSQATEAGSDGAEVVQG